jgi:sec-independent protein translocase protein TatA
MGGLSFWHWLVVLVLVLLVFGSKKLRSLGSDIGASIGGFKEGLKSTKEGASEVRESIGNLPDQTAARSISKEQTVT